MDCDIVRVIGWLDQRILSYGPSGPCGVSHGIYDMNIIWSFSSPKQYFLFVSDWIWKYGQCLLMWIALLLLLPFTDDARIIQSKTTRRSGEYPKIKYHMASMQENPSKSILLCNAFVTVNFRPHHICITLNLWSFGLFKMLSECIYTVWFVSTVPDVNAYANVWVFGCVEQMMLEKTTDTNIRHRICIMQSLARQCDSITTTKYKFHQARMAGRMQTEAIVVYF